MARNMWLVRYFTDGHVFFCEACDDGTRGELKEDRITVSDERDIAPCAGCHRPLERCQVVEFEVGDVISEGTHNDADLLNSFRSCIFSARPWMEYGLLGPRIDRAISTFNNDPITDQERQEVSDLVQELFDLLDDIAPLGTYFGAHPRDGSLFGFWELDDEESGDEEPEEVNYPNDQY